MSEYYWGEDYVKYQYVDDYKIDSIHVDEHTGDIAYPPSGGEDESPEFSDEEIGWLNKQEINALDQRDAQVGGDHYTRFNIQPWDIITEYELNFFEGSVLKYLLRWRRKNGLEDLHKARHVLAKLISDVENSEEPPF